MKRILPILLLSPALLFAQVKLPVPRNVKTLYKNGTRAADGRPGKNYWQNTASYTISVNYNAFSRLVTGTEEITYINNSPDELNEILFKLYPNLYKKGNVRDMEVDARDLTDGVNITELKINGVTKQQEELFIRGTNMSVTNVSIPAGQSTKFSVSFSYTLNKTSHIRTGEIEDGAAFIAYFFPRIAVYDDLDGWNHIPYVGSQEFYNDFCNFDASITVPTNYLVWATGDLTNCDEVLTTKYCDRLNDAATKDDIVFIVSEDDLKQGGITRGNATNTWHYKAENVTDFAFAVSDHYLWNSTSLIVDSLTGRRTRVDAVFASKHKDYYEVIDFARKTVDLMSNYFPKWPFPYNHETVFDGLDQMEYPMMVNDNPVESREDAITLTNHEIFHTMFPFYMGINETKYGWMDEGWATIGEWLLSKKVDSTTNDNYGVSAVERSMDTEADLPVTSLTSDIRGMSFFTNSYPKPAMGYLFAKDILGDSLFFKGLHFYIQQWNGKHPLPLDFFNSMNTGSGKNLNWFWKKWFYENGTADLAISKVETKTNNKQIVITSKGDKPVPIDLTISFSDGTEQTFHKSAAIWEKGNSTATFYLTTSKTITAVQLGGGFVPDVNKEDNAWKEK